MDRTAPPARVLCAALLGFSGFAGCNTRSNAGPDVYCDAQNTCTDHVYSLCDEVAHVCVTADGGSAPRCSDAATCPADRPICDAQTRSCRACLAHSDCPASGVCAGPACAAVEDVVYVDNGRCTSMKPSGAQASPFCEIADAVANLGARTFVHVQGSATPYSAAVRVDSGRVSIVGPGRIAAKGTPPAVLRVPGATCVEVMGGVVTIDGLVLEDCGGDGVDCYMGATVSLLRSSVKGARAALNAIACGMVTLDRDAFFENRSGVHVSSSPYVITNDYVVRNGPDDVAVRIDDTSHGTFAFDTVTANTAPVGQAAGIDCGGADEKSIRNAIVFGNGLSSMGSQFQGRCALQQVVTGIDSRPDGQTASPIFDDPSQGDYHLRPPPANASCIDRIAPDGVPGDLPNHDHDADGKPRPLGKGYDLGADEVQP